MKPGKNQSKNLCWKGHDRAQSLVLRSYTIFMTYDTNMFLYIGQLV